MIMMTQKRDYFDIGYFNKDVTRYIKKGKRNIDACLVAWGLDEEYYDGDRKNGYGGFTYDGRWKNLLPRIIERYQLTEKSKVLDLGCKKGFLINDLKELLPGITVKGVENHPYPIENAMESVKDDVSLSPYHELPFDDSEFDFVISFSAVYMENLRDVIATLREIERVGKGKSYITLGAFETDEGREKFLEWTLLGTTILHVDEWDRVLDHCGYQGDRYFTTAESLNLEWE